MPLWYNCVNHALSRTHVPWCLVFLSHCMDNTLSGCVTQDPQRSLSVFTTLGTAVLSLLALWGGCSFVKLTYLHQTPSWLWLVWSNSPDFTVHPTKVYGPVGTMVQIMPGLHCIMNMRQVHEYPDSTISKVLKWRMITMLNRKLLEKQRV